MTTLSLWNENPLLKGFFGANYVPPCDIEEKENYFLVSMDVPGLKKEDFQIEVDDDILTVSGERRQERNQTGQGYSRSERFSGKFYRAFSLGETFDPTRIEASYEEGVLRLKLPREKEVKPEVIKIKVGEKLNETH